MQSRLSRRPDEHVGLEALLGAVFALPIPAVKTPSLAGRVTR
jgi:hypothetical protein